MKTISIIYFLLFPAILFAQTKSTVTEDDGYTWTKVEYPSGKMGAESPQGHTLIAESEGFDRIYYSKGFLMGTDSRLIDFDENGDLVNPYFGYYTKDGRCIIAPKEYDSAYVNSESGLPEYIYIKKNDLYGVMDSEGNILLPCISYSYPYYGDSGFEIKNSEGKYELTGITLPGADPTARATKLPQTATDGYSWTRLRNGSMQNGALNHKGEYVIPMIYSSVKYLPSNTQGQYGIFAVTTEDDIIGWYDINGLPFIPVSEGYTYIRPVGIGNYAFIKTPQTDDEGVYETALGEIIPPGKYDEISWKKDGYFFTIEKDDLYGVVDWLGHQVLPPSYPTPLTREDDGFTFLDDDYNDVYAIHGVFADSPERTAEKFQRAYSSSGPQAIALYREVILMDPIGKYGYLSSCYNNIGNEYLSLGNREMAEENIRKALEIEPNRAEFLSNLENVLQSSHLGNEGNSPSRASGWDIAFGILNSFADAASTFNAATNSYLPPSQSSSLRRNEGSSRRSSKQSHVAKPKGNAFSHSVNERTSRNTYNNYVSQLIDMKTYPERYNDSQRRQIQSSMRSIRQEWGFPKSEWEDWTP